MFARRNSFILSGVALASMVMLARQASSSQWPRQVSTSMGNVVMYQPQVETFSGNQLTGRAAVSVTPPGKTSPVFGAVWMDARVSTDRNARTVTLEEVKVTQVRFPNSSPDQQKQLAELLQIEVPKWQSTISLDYLTAALEVVKKEQKEADQLDSAPPKITYSKTPAMLLVLDGPPQVRELPDQKLDRVVNTPFLILRERGQKTFYLFGGTDWYSAADPLGPWKSGAKPPKAIAKIGEEQAKKAAEDAAKADPTGTDAKAPADTKKQAPPEVIVSTEPAELIVSDGEANFAPIASTGLLTLSNSDNFVFMEIASQSYFVVFSGRWYKSPSMNGPWTYVASDKLPNDFQKIPADSNRSAVLPFVAGTSQAEDAAMDAQIPQTAAVKRDSTITVQYGGDPDFDRIAGTNMRSAVNSSVPVIQVSDMYYACSDGVWYMSNSPKGNWAVCASVPNEIYTIPPSSSAYNTKYVRVYGSTPEVVYVGYTPGYTGCYVYGPTVVYGTGYYYRGWYGPTVWYPRPVTYGFNMCYNPWTGWGFGYSYSTGPITVSIRFGHYGGWWGPPVYYPRPIYPPYPGYRPGYGYRPPYGAYPPGYRPGGYPPPGYRPPPGGAPRPMPYNNNLYNQPQNKNRMATPTQMPAAKQPMPTNRPNNVMADPNGNAVRKQPNGNWQQHDGSSWKNNPSAGGTNPKNNMNGDYNARQKGNAPSTSNANHGGSTKQGGSGASRGSGSHSGGSHSRSGGGGGQRSGGGGGRR